MTNTMPRFAIMMLESVATTLQVRALPPETTAHFAMFEAVVEFGS